MGFNMSGVKGITRISKSKGHGVLGSSFESNQRVMGSSCSLFPPFKPHSLCLGGSFVKGGLYPKFQGLLIKGDWIPC